MMSGSIDITVVSVEPDGSQCTFIETLEGSYAEFISKVRSQLAVRAIVSIDSGACDITAGYVALDVYISDVSIQWADADSVVYAVQSTTNSSDVQVLVGASVVVPDGYRLVRILAAKQLGQWQVVWDGELI